jgi:hypothetical protein
MELLLNLAWLLLAVPAYWLWRGSRSAHVQHKFTSLQCVLALGCLLVMLFPVISATDDLIAMRTEMEESPLNKRSVRQAITDRAFPWKTRLQTPPALLGAPPSFAPAVERSDLSVHSLVFLPAMPVVLPAGRAPPASSLA